MPRDERSRDASRNPEPGAENLEGVMRGWAESSRALQLHTATLMERLLTTGGSGERATPLSFDGTSSWTVFFHQFDSTCGQLPAEEKGRRLLRSLRGQAANLVQTLPREQYSSYEALYALLDGHYDPAQRATVAEAELERRVQRADETVRAYGTDIMRLARQAYPNWAENALQTNARQALIRGLRSAEMRRELRLRPIASFAETLNAALHIEAVEEQEPLPKRPRITQVATAAGAAATPSGAAEYNSVAGAQRIAPQLIDPQQQSATSATTDSRLQEFFQRLQSLMRSFQPTQGERRCYTCQQAGHFAHDCPVGGRQHSRRSDDEDSRQGGQTED